MYCICVKYVDGKERKLEPFLQIRREWPNRHSPKAQAISGTMGKYTCPSKSLTLKFFYNVET